MLKFTIPNPVTAKYRTNAADCTECARRITDVKKTGFGDTVALNLCGAIAREPVRAGVVGEGADFYTYIGKIVTPDGMVFDSEPPGDTSSTTKMRHPLCGKVNPDGKCRLFVPMPA